MPPRDCSSPRVCHQDLLLLVQDEPSIQDRISQALMYLEDTPSSALHDTERAKSLLNFLTTCCCQDSRALLLAQGAVEIVVNLLRSHPADVSLLEYAVLFLLNMLDCASHDVLFDAIVKEMDAIGCVECVIGGMEQHPTEYRLQCASASILYLIVLEGGQRGAVTQSMAPMISAMKLVGGQQEISLDKRVNLLLLGCRFMAKLLEADEQIKEEIENAGGIAILVDCLRYPDPSGSGASLFIYACQAIALLGQECERVQKAFGNEGAVDAILSRMAGQPHIASTKLQLASLNAISSLIGNHADLLTTFGSNYGMQVMMDISEMHVRNEKVMLLTLRLCTKLARIDKEARVQISCSLLVDAMAHHVFHDEIQVNALQLISFWLQDRHPCLMIRTLGTNPLFLRTIVAAMLLHSEDEAIQLASGEIFKHLCVYFDLSRELLRLGGLILLVDAMLQFPMNENIQETFCFVIEDVICNEAVLHEMHTSGVVSALTDAIRRGSYMSKTFQVCASRVLELLTQSSNNPPEEEEAAE